MKKVYLKEIRQNNHVFYSGVLPEKDLVRLATTKEFNTPQDAQRPIDLIWLYIQRIVVYYSDNIKFVFNKNR